MSGACYTSCHASPCHASPLPPACMSSQSGGTLPVGRWVCFGARGERVRTRHDFAATWVRHYATCQAQVHQNANGGAHRGKRKTAFGARAMAPSSNPAHGRHRYSRSTSCRRAWSAADLRDDPCSRCIGGNRRSFIEHPLRGTPL